MKKGASLFFLLIFSVTISGFGQHFKNAGEYINFIGQQHREIATDVLAYTSAIAHDKSPRKVENKRQSMLHQIKTSIRRISTMPPFQGDGALRDSTGAYLRTSYLVLNNEYSKILNLEDLAGKSFDDMETFMKAQELAAAHLDKAEARLNAVTKLFAGKYGVNLLDNKDDELSRKLTTTNKVNNYQQHVYLAFFKANKQEVHLVEAITKRDTIEMAKQKNLLLNYVKEGLARLDTIKPYEGDASLADTARKALWFYASECNEKLTVITTFITKEAEFKNLKKAWDAKKQNERTQPEIDQYNKAVDEYNYLIHYFQETVRDLNTDRTKAVASWNKTSENFLDKYVPWFH